MPKIYCFDCQKDVKDSKSAYFEHHEHDVRAVDTK